MFKKLIKITLSIVLILLVLIVFALLPGHLQIRKVEIEIPELSQIEQIFSNQVSTDLPVNIQYVNTATQEGPFGTLGHLGVLISWADGRQFLIDTGMNSEEAQKFGAPLELLGAGPTTTYGAIEEQLGGYVDSIQGIGFTHLHSDHTAGVSDICIALRSRNDLATIFQTKAQSSLHNTFTKQGQAFINGSDCEIALLGDALLKPVPNFAGLYAIEAGGHTPGSTVFITQLAGKIWVFAGDLTNTMDDIHNNQDKGWVYSHLLVPEDTKLLERWRIWLEQADQKDNVSVLVAHDINAFEASDLSHWQESFDEPLDEPLDEVLDEASEEIMEVPSE